MRTNSVCRKTAQQVKQEMIHALEQELESLKQWAEEDWQGETLHDLEKEAHKRAMRVGQVAVDCRLAGHRGYEGWRRKCACSGWQKFVDYRPRCVGTLVGSVQYQRAYYWCKGCESGVSPFDTALQVERGQFSEGMVRLMAYAGAQSPSFAQAAQSIEKSSEGRLRVGVNTVRRKSERIGAEITVKWEQERLGVEKGTRAVEAEMAETVEMEADGTMIPTQEGWKEVKVGSVVSYDEAGNELNKMVFGRVGNAERFGNRLWLEAKKQGVERAKAVAALGDGAAWIWNQFALIHSPAVEILDFYHVKERLYGLAAVVYGEGDERGKGWVKERERELLSQEPEKAIQAVKRLRPRTQEGKAKKHETVQYLEANRKRMRYHEYEAAGWPIGSGRVEGAARTFVGQRIKGGGARWVADNAQFILDLRSKIEYGGWESFWKQRFTST